MIMILWNRFSLMMVAVLLGILADNTARAAACGTPVQCYEAALQKLEEAHKLVAQSALLQSQVDALRARSELYTIDMTNGQNCNTVCEGRCVAAWNKPTAAAREKTFALGKSCEWPAAGSASCLCAK
jgi:hypothetical protein